jgi:hypothetical protein
MMPNYEKHISVRVKIADVPLACLQAYIDSNKDGTPTAMGFTKKTGWFVIWTAGQGPGLAWQEHCEYATDKGKCTYWNEKGTVFCKRNVCAWSARKNDDTWWEERPKK